jgi:hypothetical protein
MIIDVVRTGSGKGKPGGALSQVHPATLLATALVALLDRNDFDPVLIDDVIVGCVTQSGEQSLNVGRTAVLAAGLSESVPAVTIDRQCGSGQQAAHFAAQGVMAGAYGRGDRLRGRVHEPRAHVLQHPGTGREWRPGAAQVSSRPGAAGGFRGADRGHVRLEPSRAR